MPEANWRDALPDDIKGSPALANFQDIGQMAKSFIEIKSFQGNSIRIPGEDAGDEDKAAYVKKLMDSAPTLMIRPDFNDKEQSKEFYRTMGTPESAEEYQEPNIEYPEGVKPDPDRTKAIKELAMELNLTKPQYEKLMIKMTQDDIDGSVSGQKTHKEDMESLNKEWGQATKDRMSDALSIAERTKAPDHLIDSIKKGEMSSEMAKWMYSLSVSIGAGEGVNSNGNQASDNSTMTPIEAKEKIAEIYKNKDHPFYNGDKDALEHMVKLVAAANPGTNTDINQLRAGGAFGG